MANERKTENIVRDLLKENGYYDDKNIIIEEQTSDNPRIDKLLKKASKSGTGKGYPEFVISFVKNLNNLIVIECKANITQHESNNRKQYKDYAVDGALLYASYLKDEFNVTAIAVSGSNHRDKKISSFLWLKGNFTYREIQDKILLKPQEINNEVINQSKPLNELVLIKKANEYNYFVHKHSIPEVERCTLISAVLIALQDEAFLNSFKHQSSNRALIEAMLTACKNVLLKNSLDSNKIEVILSEYSKFKHNKDFTSDNYFDKKQKKDLPNTILRDFVSLINDEILPYIKNSEFDVLGKFYTQFIRYAGSDKKTGLVLTPTHITDLFCEIAELNANDVVFDPCCGTSSFLVSAMNYMIKKAGLDSVKHTKIKSEQLIGIEKRADMFAHACSNMMMRGDGKSNIFYGDCFGNIKVKNDKRQIETLKLIKHINNEFKPTKAFLNPPYQDGNAVEQLEFIENALECLLKDGICVAICQMSTAVSSAKEIVEVRKRLLGKHTLEAAFSMPDDLFHPIPVNTSILVFKAHNQHLCNKKTFFGYFKYDGFVKARHKGRIDVNKLWQDIKNKWLITYRNKESIAGLSVMQQVKPTDEWCAEAYMDIDYGLLENKKFIKTIKDFSTFCFGNNLIESASSEKIIKNANLNISDTISSWIEFKISEIMRIEKCKCGTAETSLFDLDVNDGGIAYVGAKKENNGVQRFVVKDKNFVSRGNGIVFVCTGAGAVGYTTYQLKDFIGHTNTAIGYSEHINIYTAMFLVTVLDLQRPKYSYGRSYNIKAIKQTKIKLPIDKNGNPDWQFMEDYIKSLPYSRNLK